MLALSVGQESLWTLYRVAPDSAAYNDADGLAFRPAPDEAALRAALRDLASRHDLLRSRFHDGPGHAVREVRDPGLVDLEVRDVPGGGDPRTALRRSVRAIAAEPLDLEGRGPLRAVLLRRPADAVLVLVCHHIAGDATSQRIIWRDLLEFYRARIAGDAPALPALRSTYDDFVRAEREMLGSERGAELAGYWRDECAGARPAELPTSRPRPDTPGFRGSTVDRRLDDDLADRVREAARTRGITPFALTLGAFQALVHRYVAGGDLLIGCPTTLRRSLATRDLVGLLVNTVPLRSGLAPSTTFEEVAAAAAARLGAASRRARFPFALMEGGGEAGKPGRAPALRIGITMVGGRGDPLLDLAASGEWMEHAGHRIAVLDLPRLEGQTDLTVEIGQSTGGLSVAFRYDVDLFTGEAVTRLLERFLRFVRVSVDDPAAEVGRVPLAEDAGEIASLLALGSG
ncbi:condensation domain-containing protein [Actinomadura rubrisoli]|uniref:condensation domain-containing protein n=1 Tax=Actinomadura rubrisoli TaxID=2530368 RepID=UPI001405148D|nr:condensation domain-containing protein [Actinomadura rubrisoli]